PGGGGPHLAAAPPGERRRFSRDARRTLRSALHLHPRSGRARRKLRRSVGPPSLTSFLSAELGGERLDVARAEPAAAADDANASLDPPARMDDEVGRREALVELPARRHEGADVRVDADRPVPVAEDGFERVV